MSRVLEAQVFHYLFLAAHLESGKVPSRPGAEELTGLGKAVADLYGWLNLQPPEPFPPNPSLDDGKVLYPTRGQPEWSDAHGQRACRAFAYVEQGAVVLQRAIGQRDTASGGATWNHLRAAVQAVPASLPASRFFWGSWVCYGGRVADEMAARATAEAALVEGPPGRPGVLRCTRIGSDLWLFDRLGLPDMIALFCASDEAEERASDYFNNVLPTAAIYLKKIAYLYGKGYRAGGRDRLRRLEDHMAETLACSRLLEPDPGQKDSAVKLEGQLRDVARAYSDFAGALALFKEIQNTVSVNAANLKELLDQHGLRSEGPPAAWRNVVNSAMDQLAADDRYYEARTREAEITLRLLEAQAELAREAQERRENDLAEKRNYRLNLLIAVVGYAAVILAFVSDDTVKALLRQWYGGEPAGFSLGELLLGKLALSLLMAVGLSILVLGLLVAFALIRWASKKPPGEEKAVAPGDGIVHRRSE